MLFFTADPHFCHANIISHCARPFADVEEMNEALIERWNRRVGERDTVWILGDLAFTKPARAEAVLERLRGRKRLIVGNHDSSWLRVENGERFFESVSRMEVVKENGRRLTLCHYPLMAWDGMGGSGLLIYGHIHNNRADLYWPLLRTYRNALNAGVDINDFEPVTLPELEENNRIYLESL